MSATPTFGRYAEMPVDQMSPEQREGYRFLVDGPRGRLPGPPRSGCTIPGWSTRPRRSDSTSRRVGRR